MSQFECFTCCDLGFVKFTDFDRPRPPFEFRQMCPKGCSASQKWSNVHFREDYPGMAVFDPPGEDPRS